MSELQGEAIAVLGGTGPRGRALARRFVKAGLNVVLGSRITEKGGEGCGWAGRDHGGRRA